MSSLLSRLAETVRCVGHNHAILSESSCLTHQEVADLSDRVAIWLIEQGIRPRDRVALYAVNGPEFPILYLGILKAGATVVPVNLLINRPEVEYVLNDSGARGMLSTQGLLNRLGLDLSSCPDLLFSLEVGGSSDIDQALTAVLAQAPAHWDPPVISDLDLAAILYTSGTTGFPKGAMLSHGNLASNTSSVTRAMAWRPGQDRVLVVLPMFHAFAATVGVLTPLTNGSAIVPLARFEPDLVAEAIGRFQATIFLGVPSMYGVLLRLQPDRTPLFRSLRFGVSGGAALPLAVHQAFEARFSITLYEGDGPTECSPVTCVNPIGGLNKPGTVGLPVPDVEMRIIDAFGNEQAVGEVGEIAVRGPSVMQGYWRQPDATSEVFLDGWFLTGDLGMQDEDGYFSIVDRKKDLIIVNGMNVYPRMIEEVLNAHPDVLEAAVIGERNERHGEVPVAYVALTPLARLEARQLRDYCRSRLGTHQIPKRFEIREALPKNAAGKIMKRELRKQGEIERGVDLSET